ncbi:hypothetical protein C2G38_2286557 [Gigaspora rosea]|uniref:ATP-dependent helicase Rep n=1 Tax=Gigaspora rosea TaxID=44941 RepID=A0A397U449_9GLOM|nr:hypothetical protein C2G38_2286557 [Gigaspora rosea]
MRGETYIHVMVTSYHCSPCKKKFICKKTFTKKNKQKREEENEHTEKSVCFLCNKKHWRCRNDKCVNCCERNKCNDIICYHCRKDGIRCTRPFPRTQEKFSKFESKVSYINWQFEPTKDEILHSQVYIQFKTRITLKAIKELFDDSSMFIKKIKTTSLLAKLYSEKMYNHCEKHKNCKCNYYDLSKICEHCDKTCKRKPARWGRGELSEDITGPFEFGKFREIENFTNKKYIESLEDYKLQEYEAIVEGNKMLVDGATPLEVFKHNLEKVQYSHNYDGMKKIYEDLQQEKKKETCRFWRPVTFYLFGPGRSGKTGLVQELFSDELYDKPKKQRSGSNWWNGYEGQEIVLIDEFYTKIDWGHMVNVLNDSCHNVKKKHSGFEPFIAKYVFLTATKPPEEAYNFSQTGVT